MRENKPKRYDMGLMTFACLLSSLLVYNIKGNIDSSAIETLQLMTRVVEQLKKKKKNRKNFANYFPKFLWVLRDFFLEMVDGSGKKISPKEYLDNNLDVAARVKQTDSDGDSDDSEEDDFDIVLTDETKRPSLTLEVVIQKTVEFLYTSLVRPVRRYELTTYGILGKCYHYSSTLELQLVYGSNYVESNVSKEKFVNYGNSNQITVKVNFK
eukprot:TRINITY_DN4046_c0_g1_i1.p1 TRINITY_DN4046_c0_g1~~TRINITY_DN4046_c0_g1_i1.p1  ORF type:complete len:211 (-),score=18.08 TRINITY_DN4046_c0_g1_i1:54-686(-)